MFTLDLPAADIHDASAYPSGHYIAAEQYPPLEQYPLLERYSQDKSGFAALAGGGVALTPNLSFFMVDGFPVLVCGPQNALPTWCLPVQIHGAAHERVIHPPAKAITSPRIDGSHIQHVGCGAAVGHPALTLFDMDHPFSAGWNHIGDPAKAADFSGLRQPFSAYAINHGNFHQDTTCTNERSYRTLLVKKLHTWNNSHANGLETHFEGLPVNAIESLVIELKLHSERSFIPSIQQIHAVYPQLSKAQVRSLDKGMANIELVLSAGKYRANQILTIEPDIYADQWVRITIPLENMNHYTEVDYARTPMSYSAAATQRYTSLIINAESQSRKTVQHLMNRQAGKVQLFKELDISIRNIQYLLKQSGNY